MLTVPIDEIQKDLRAYLELVRGGETVIVTDLDRPVAEIKSLSESDKGVSSRGRPYGLCAGLFTVPDDFDEPLPEDILRIFEGA